MKMATGKCKLVVPRDDQVASLEQMLVLLAQRLVDLSNLSPESTICRLIVIRTEDILEVDPCHQTHVYVRPSMRAKMGLESWAIDLKKV